MRRTGDGRLVAAALALALAACGLGAPTALADDEDVSAGVSEENASSLEEYDESEESAEEEEESSDEDEEAQALDAEGNEVDPTQLPDSSFIYDTSIVDLSTADTYYDGQTVQVIGEVIGDNLVVAGDEQHRWITLSAEDADASVEVYMTTESAAKIDTFGDYAATGTMLQVRGTFHLACEEHDGATDLHADVVTVTARGEKHPDSFDVNDFIPGAVAVGAGLLMMLVFFLLRERLR